MIIKWNRLIETGRAHTHKHKHTLGEPVVMLNRCMLSWLWLWHCVYSCASVCTLNLFVCVTLFCASYKYFPMTHFQDLAGYACISFVCRVAPQSISVYCFFLCVYMCCCWLLLLHLHLLHHRRLYVVGYHFNRITYTFILHTIMLYLCKTKDSSITKAAATLFIFAWNSSYSINMPAEIMFILSTILCEIPLSTFPIIPFATQLTITLSHTLTHMYAFNSFIHHLLHLHLYHRPFPH